MGRTVFWAPAIAAAGLLAGLSQAIRADVIVLDTFSLNGTTRTEGTTLNNLPVETGTGTWDAASSPDVRLSAAGAVVRGATNASFGCFAGTTNPTTVTSVSVQTVVSNAGWVAVGFAKTYDEGKNFYSSNAALWVTLTGTGYATVYGETTSTVLMGTKAAPNRTDAGWADALHTLTLQYDPGAKAFNLIVDDTSVTNGWKSLGAVILPEIRSAGFQVSTAGTGTLIDRFELSTVPEPASLGVSGTGAVLLLAGRHRR
jgi:hypothetical protein